MPVKLADAVVVVTGASSGIGKAAALEFAARGAQVVLAARRAEALAQTAMECHAQGVVAVAVPTDVTDEQAVRDLARKALEIFGRIDVWVNNAAVSTAGRFLDTPAEAFRRVMDTNFFGYVHGARAALPIFRKQGHGVLINTASMVSRISEPYFSSYVASKHAIRGWTMSLRQELTLEGAKDTHVCAVMPASIDTPFFQHAANYTGRFLQAMPPVYPAERVAKAMVACAEKPRREFFVGGAARLFNARFLLSSALAETMVAKSVDRVHLLRHKTAPRSDGSVFAPMAEGTTVEGGWRKAGILDKSGSPGAPRGLSRARARLGKGVLATAGLALAYARGRTLIAI